MLQIPVKLPFSFEDALGYPRGFRWVAFFWEPCGDEAMYDDGYCSGDGNWHGFLEFTRHPKVAPWLAGYNLGSSEDEATHWLLCDLESRDVFVGERAEIKSQLASEVKKYVPELESKAEIPAADIKKILGEIRDFMREVPAPSMATIMAKMKKDQEAVEKMVAELR